MSKEKLDLLSGYENYWPTAIGAWNLEENAWRLKEDKKVILRGKELFTELKGMRWMEMLLFAITGRRFTNESVQLFEIMWSYSTNYPDPRLWPNGVAALAATTRSTCTLGTAGALAICEAVNWGHRSNIRAIDFLYRTKKKLDHGENLDEIVEKELKTYRGLGGYGRPLLSTDERIDPISKMAGDLGFGDGYYLKLAEKIEKVLKKWRRNMNVSGLIAALSADQGLSVREHYTYMTLCFTGGMFPCYLDALEKPEGAFFPVRCADIQYEGNTPRRSWCSSNQEDND